MRTITLYVSHVVSGLLTVAIDGASPAVAVRCVHRDYHSINVRERTFIVTVAPHSVTVQEAHGSGPFTNPSDVLVATDLIDATRRLYNLVGQS